MMEKEAIEQILDKIFTVYFVQGLTTLGVLYLIFSGTIKKFFIKIFSFKKVKYKDIELVSEEEHSGNERRQEVRRTSDKTSCMSECTQFKNVTVTLNELKTDNTDIKVKITKIEEHLNEVFMNQLKRTFFDKDQPLSDRIHDGLRYVCWGGNGYAKNEIIRLLLRHHDLYEIAVKQDARLRVKEIEEIYEVKENVSSDD